MMPMPGMAPPPAADVAAQMTPFDMSQRGGAAPAPGGPPAPPQEESPAVAQVMTALIHLKQAMQAEPDLGPAFSSAIQTIQVALGTVLGKHRGAPGGPAPGGIASAAPPESPSVGLPI